MMWGMPDVSAQELDEKFLKDSYEAMVGLFLLAQAKPHLDEVFSTMAQGIAYLLGYSASSDDDDVQDVVSLLKLGHEMLDQHIAARKARAGA